MPNTTVDYWDVDGISLNTFVQNLESWGGSREEPAPFRGENQKIPYAYGERFVEKMPARRTMGLRGWMTSERTGPDSEANLKLNWREFRKLLWRPHEEFSLTRRWTDAAGAPLVATGLAQYKSGLSPEINGNQSLKFEVELEMADPFFYAPERSLLLTNGVYATILEPGDHPTKKMFVDLVGPLTTPKLTFIQGAGTPTTISTMSYPTIATGTTVLIDIENFKATETTSGVTTKTSTKVTNTLTPEWARMGRYTTLNPRVLLNGAGTGTATLRYRPAYH